MSNYFLTGLLFLAMADVHAQTTTPSLYDPAANAEKDITAAIKKAKAENKHVLL